MARTKQFAIFISMLLSYTEAYKVSYSEEFSYRHCRTFAECAKGAVLVVLHRGATDMHAEIFVNGTTIERFDDIELAFAEARHMRIANANEPIHVITNGVEWNDDWGAAFNSD